MIIKGGPRAKQAELARHLLRADTNETIRLFDVACAVATDLKGALAEMAAIASGSRCTKFLYHASISPGAAAVLSDDQWRTAIAELESALGLSGHQRTVVLHTKKDRQHAHVVWNRVDVETLKAAQHSHNFRTHEQVARKLERAFGLEHVQGVHVDQKGQRPPRRETTKESQQAARTGWTTEQAKQDITAAWEHSENGAEFAAALTDAGYRLARGDRKAMVVLDPAGGVHGIARRIDGVRAADVRRKLADLDPRSLPSLDDARADLANAPARPAPKRSKPEKRDEPSLQPATPRASAAKPPERYAAIKVRVVQSPTPDRPPIATTPRPLALTPRPTPPSWARTPVQHPSMIAKAGLAGPRPLHASAQSQATPPELAHRNDAERAAQMQRQAKAAAVESANLDRFHTEQIAQLDQHHQRRLGELVHEVEQEIVRHNGIANRVGHIAAKGEYHRKLAYLVAKREGIRQREIARQAQVRAELKAAQQKERAEAAQRRGVRERLERDALERRLADQRTALSHAQKERPGLEGPGG